MEIWALSSDKKHSWHRNYVLLLPPGRYCSAKSRDMWLLLLAAESSHVEKPAGWHQAPARGTIGVEWGVRDQTCGLSTVRKSREGHGDRVHM